MQTTASKFRERFGNPSSIEPPGKHFNRWKEVTPESVKARLMELNPRLVTLDAEQRSATIVINFAYHYHSAIDYRVFFGGNPEAKRMRTVENLAGLAEFVLQRKGQSSRLNRQHSTAFLFGQVVDGPVDTRSPYEQVCDLPGGRVAPFVSRSRLTKAIELAATLVVGYLGLRFTGLPSNSMAAASFGFTVAALGVYGAPHVQNEILMSTWRLHSRQVFEAVERFGVDGFMVAAMEPWRVFTIMRRLEKLEREGILSHDGLTEQGKTWYVDQMAQTFSAIILANRGPPK